MTGKVLKAYKGHLTFKCFHVHVRTPLGDCYLNGKRVYRKNFSISHRHYISPSKIFAKFAGRISMAIYLRVNTIAIVADEIIFC